MLTTTDRKLSDDQIRRIERLEEEWFAELGKLPPLNLGPCELSHSANKTKRDLNNKYTSLIREVLQEEK